MPDFLPRDILTKLRVDDFNSEASSLPSVFKPTPAPAPTPAPEPARPAFQLPSWQDVQIGAQQATGAVQEAASKFQLPSWEQVQLGGQQVAERVQQATGAFKLPDFETFSFKPPVADEPARPGLSSPGTQTAGAGAVPPSAPAVGGGQATSDPASILGIGVPAIDVGKGRDAVLQAWAPALRSIESGGGPSARNMGAIILAENGAGQAGQLAPVDNNWFSISTVPSRQFQAGPGTGGRFARYASPLHSAADFVDLIQNSPRYADAWAKRNGPTEAFIGALAAGGYIVPEPGFPVETWLKNTSAGAETFDRAAGTVPVAAPQPSGPQAVAAPPRSGSDIDQAALADPDKWSLCGPVAAAIAAARYGVNWTVAQAKKIAVDQGLWDANTGMYGLQAEVKMLTAGGVPAEVGGEDHARMARDAAAGNTVIISTPKHYFVAQDFDPKTNRFLVGTTGKVLRGGSEWMTLDQIKGSGGGVQGVAYVDNPDSPVPLTGHESSESPTPAPPTTAAIPDKAVAFGLPDDAGQLFEPMERPKLNFGDSERGPSDPPGYSQDSTYGRFDPEGYGGNNDGVVPSAAVSRLSANSGSGNASGTGDTGDLLPQVEPEPSLGDRIKRGLGDASSAATGVFNRASEGLTNILNQGSNNVTGSVNQASDDLTGGLNQTAEDPLVKPSVQAVLDTPGNINTAAQPTPTEAGARDAVLARTEAYDLPEEVKFALRGMQSADDIVIYLNKLLGAAVYEPIRDTIIKPLLQTIKAEHHIETPVGEIGTADLVTGLIPGVGATGGGARAGAFGERVLRPSETVIGRPAAAAADAVMGSEPIRRAGELIGGLRDTATAMTRGLPGGASRVVDDAAPAPRGDIADPTLAAEADRFSAGQQTGRGSGLGVVPGRPARDVDIDRLRPVQVKPGMWEVRDGRGDIADEGVWFESRQAAEDAAAHYTDELSYRPGPDKILPHPAGELGNKLGVQATGGALAGGYSASQEEGADLESVTRGAALGAVGGVARGRIARRGMGQVGQVARAVDDVAPEGTPRESSPNLGGIRGLSNETQAQRFRRERWEREAREEAGARGQSVGRVGGELPAERPAIYGPRGETLSPAVPREQFPTEGATALQPEPVPLNRGSATDRAGEKAREAILDARGKPITLTTPEEIARLRLDHFPEEVRNELQAAATDVDFGRAQRRGVIPDDVANELADTFRQSAEHWIRQNRAGRSYSEEQTLALRNLAASTALNVHDLTLRIDAARAAGTTPDLLIAQRANESNKLNGLAQVVEGARAEAGRSLRAWGMEARLLKDNPSAAIERIYRKVGDRAEAEKIAEEYSQAVKDGADPFAIAKIWGKVERGEIKTGERFALYRRFNMLSGPRTLEVNATSGLINMVGEEMAAAGGSLARGDVRGAAAELAAPVLGLQRAARGFAQVWAHGITEEQALRGDIPRNLSARATNKLDKAQLMVQELPDKFNSSVDQFWRATAESLGLAQYAAQQTRGMKGKARAEAMSFIMTDPDKAAADAAEKMANRVTFQGDMGATGRGLQQLGVHSPFVANLVMPFLRTVYHITTRSIDFSPLGAATTAQELLRSAPGISKVGQGAYAAGKELPKGVPELSARVRDNVAGTLVFAWAYDQARQGNLTGMGPEDNEKREELRATGWRPYSIKIGDSYHSYANVAPLMVALSSAAAANEAQKYGKDGATVADAFTDGAARTVKVIGDMSIVSGVGAIMKSLQDSERYGGQWLTQFLQTLIPAGSALNTVGQATDTEGERRSLPGSDFGTKVSEGLKSRIPQNPLTPDRGDVPLVTNPLGDTVPNQQQGLASLQPTRPSKEQDAPLVRAFLDAGVDIGAPAKALTFGKDGKVPLSPEESRQWQQLRGASLKAGFEVVKMFPNWDGQSPAERAALMQLLLDESNKAAKQQLSDQITFPELERRLKPAS